MQMGSGSASMLGYRCLMCSKPSTPGLTKDLIFDVEMSIGYVFVTSLALSLLLKYVIQCVHLISASALPAHLVPVWLDLRSLSFVASLIFSSAALIL